jgi:hypothetical protein
MRDNMRPSSPTWALEMSRKRAGGCNVPCAGRRAPKGRDLSTSASLKSLEPFSLAVLLNFFHGSSTRVSSDILLCWTLIVLPPLHRHVSTLSTHPLPSRPSIGVDTAYQSSHGSSAYRPPSMLKHRRSPPARQLAPPLANPRTLDA